MYKLNLYEIPNFLQKQARHTVVQQKRNRITCVNGDERKVSDSMPAAAIVSLVFPPSRITKSRFYTVKLNEHRI